MKLRTLALAALLSLAAASAAAADPAKVGYPNSIASTGDSITRAFNTCSFPFIDCPANSWATGSSSTVASHYWRILQANPLISGRSYNDAKTGAKMVDLNGQVTTVSSQHVDYVTVLMGANNVCTSSEATMTPVDTVRAQLRQALDTLAAGSPDTRILVATIPDIYNLWNVLHTNFAAVFVWSIYGICQSMLANPTSTAPADVARRARVRQRNIDDNAAIAAVCARYIHCRFDGNAAFATQFAASDVSTRDYFHPSVSGQAKAARVTWAATFDFTDRTAPVSAAATAPDAAGGTDVTLSATDNVAVAGIEFRTGAAGAWTRYTGTVVVAAGTTITWRAVDVNGNIEATQTLTG
jgi:lysophospholipase L1-like esterase